jgi:hypothetical protein
MTRMDSIQWIWENRKWLFSGIGVAVIGLLLSLLAKTCSRKQRGSPSGLAAGAADEPPVRKLTSVLAEFAAAPLLQQADLVKHYVGLRARLSGQITSAEYQGDTVKLILSSGLSFGRYGAIFQIDPRAHRGMGLLKQGTPATVVGDIAHLTRDWATLENVDFTIDQ